MNRVRIALILCLGLMVAACDAAHPSSSPGLTYGAGDSPIPSSSKAPAPPTSSADRFPPDPDATAYAVRDPHAPTRLAGTAHDIDLAIHERFMTVAAGYVQAVWTVDGTVPGPVIRVGLGDAVRVRLVNAPPASSYPDRHPSVNLYPHALVFDGSTQTRAGQAAPVRPLDQGTFELTADRAGVWLYHGSTEPVLRNIVNGLYGMMIVEPRSGLDPVDQELFLVQGEWYLGGQYRPEPPLPSLERAAAGATPDRVALNGIADQYVDHPIDVPAGRRIRVFVLNAGPNLHLSFQIDGLVFDRVLVNDDQPSAGPDAEPRPAVVDLAPGEGAVVELTVTAPGRYLIRTGAAGAGGRGALGWLVALDRGL